MQIAQFKPPNTPPQGVFYNQNTTEIMENFEFRGVSIETNQMIKGYLFEDIPKYGNRRMSYIIEGGFVPALTMPTRNFKEVIPDTIGLASSRKDRNGNTVFCGDILRRYKKAGSPYKGLKVVKYEGDCWENVYFSEESEIVGNIYENPSLLAPKVK